QRDAGIVRHGSPSATRRAPAAKRERADPRRPIAAANSGAADPARATGSAGSAGSEDPDPAAEHGRANPAEDEGQPAWHRVGGDAGRERARRAAEDELCGAGTAGLEPAGAAAGATAPRAVPVRHPLGHATGEPRSTHGADE